MSGVNVVSGAGGKVSLPGEKKQHQGGTNSDSLPETASENVRVGARSSSRLE